VDAPKLTGDQLQTLANLCLELQLTNARMSALQRIAAGGYGGWLRHQALADLTKIHAAASALREAVTTLAEVHPAWGNLFAEDAREAVAEAVTPENFAQFKEAILELVRCAPEHDRVSNLLGLCSQVAQRLGKDEPARRLADDLKLAALERDETLAWDGFIERWEIAGPYRYTSQDTIFEPERGYLAESPASNDTSRPRPSSSSSSSSSIPTGPQRSEDEDEGRGRGRAVPVVRWQPTDPRRVLGLVRVGQVLGLKNEELAGQVAYARTTLNSPEERRVTLCLGTDDWAKLWLNGELIHTFSGARFCALDQDRLTVPLKPGANTILLKLGNNSDAWTFCLRVAEGSDGLVLARQ
jgi:hypothetical protein